MSKITKNQRIETLEDAVGMNWSDMKKIETRLNLELTGVLHKLEALEEFATYADNMLTVLNHALPDPEYDAKCEAEAADIDASLDRHRERLGLSKPQPSLRGSELTKKLLDSQKLVMCWVHDVSDEWARKRTDLRIIYTADPCDGRFEDTESIPWSYAVPVDPITGNEITELPSIDPKPGDVLLREDWHDYFEEGARYIVTDDLRVKDLQGDEWPFLRKTKDLYVFGLNDAATACFVKAEDAVNG